MLSGLFLSYCLFLVSCLFKLFNINVFFLTFIHRMIAGLVYQITIVSRYQSSIFNEKWCENKFQFD